MPNYTVAGQVPTPQLGLSQAPAPEAAATPSPDQGLGLTSAPANVASPEVTNTAPDYNTLKSDATTAYLANGGTQANVDQYFANNPTPNYTQLASDAAQWYTGQNPGDAANQQVGNYFGIAPPPAGQNYNFGGAPAAAAPAAPAAPSPYPQSWIDTYNQMDPATQAQVQARYSGMTPEQIMADWNTNVMPNYATGTTPQQILSGAPTGPNIAQGQPTGAAVAQHKADEAAFGAGSGTIYDPWNQITPNQQGQLPQGYAYGPGTPGGTQTIGGKTGYVPARPGGIIKWDEPKGPQGGFTMAGQQQMNSPVSAGGQTFPNFQSFIDFMRTSTPAEQGVKKELSTAQNPAGGSLFDALAPYLTPNATTPPMGATPFTNWNPTSLLDMLIKSGVLK